MRSSDLSQLFRSDRFPSNLIRQYVDLLNKFEVALPWSTDHLLVPSLLPEQQIGNRNVMPGTSTVVARAMNMAAYTENRVLRRQYLMSYVPSGFWARLITRYETNQPSEPPNRSFAHDVTTWAPAWFMIAGSSQAVHS